MAKPRYKPLGSLLAEQMKIGGSTPEIDDAIQKAVYECLGKYLSGEVKEFPVDVAGVLFNAMEYVVQGFTPELFKIDKNRGQRNNPPEIEKAIMDAVRYIEFCRAGIVKDKSPNKTVREAYGVQDSTVRSWARNEKYKLFDLQYEISIGEGEHITGSMEFSAKIYRGVIAALSSGAFISEPVIK